MPQWSAADIAVLIDRMRERTDGFRVGARTAPLIIAALETYLAILRNAGAVAPPVAEEIIRIVEAHLGKARDSDKVGPFRVDEFAPGGAMVECIALCRSILVARGAYEAAVADRSGRAYMLRDKTRIIARSDGSEPPGPHEPAPGLRVVPGKRKAARGAPSPCSYKVLEYLFLTASPHCQLSFEFPFKRLFCAVRRGTSTWDLLAYNKGIYSATRTTFLFPEPCCLSDLLKRPLDVSSLQFHDQIARSHFP